MKMPYDLARSMKMETMMPHDSHYPTLFLEWDHKYDLPESGTMEVKFVRRSVSTRENKDGSVLQSVDLDIVSIEDVKAGKVKEKPEKKTEEILDEAVKEYQEDEDGE